MTDSQLERWGSAGMLTVCALVGLPVLARQLAGADVTTGPWWLWWVAYACYLTAVVLAFLLGDLWERPALLLALLVPSSAAMVLLAPRTGWTAVLLVFTTAIAAHLVPLRVTLGLLVLNSAVAGVTASLAGAPTAEVALAAGFYALLQACTVWAVLSENRASAASERLAVANAELRAATALLAESSRANERLRIARELHDVVGHQLTALALELEVASHRSTPPASEHVERARVLAKDLLTDVRATVGEIRGRPPQLRGALHAIVADLPRPRVHLDVADAAALDEDRVSALIRCVQEIVTNAIRHSQADNLWISVGADASGEVTLTARDDGCGAQLLRLGNGLTGLRERVEHLGGEVRFDTRSGFCVTAKVPAP